MLPICCRAAFNLPAASRSLIRYKYNAAQRLSEIQSEVAGNPGRRTKLRYDGRGFLSNSDFDPIIGESPQKWKTMATYSSEGILRHTHREQQPSPLTVRKAAPLIEVSM